MPVADKTIEALLEDAVALRRKGAFADAAGRYRQVLQSDPQHVDALYYLAQLSCQQGDVAGGVDLVRRALAVDPRHGRSHNLLGMALSALGAPQDALASFDAAIRFQPELASAHGSRGDVLVMLGRLGGGQSYDRALTINPALIEPWCNQRRATETRSSRGSACEL